MIRSHALGIYLVLRQLIELRRQVQRPLDVVAGGLLGLFRVPFENGLQYLSVLPLGFEKCFLE